MTPLTIQTTYQNIGDWLCISHTIDHDLILSILLQCHNYIYMCVCVCVCVSIFAIPTKYRAYHSMIHWCVIKVLLIVQLIDHCIDMHASYTVGCVAYLRALRASIAHHDNKSLRLSSNYSSTTQGYRLISTRWLQRLLSWLFYSVQLLWGHMHSLVSAKFKSSPL